MSDARVVALTLANAVLFDKLGFRTMGIETDPFGNFLGQGYEVGSGRDWARLGNLYLQDGVWNGERLGGTVARPLGILNGFSALVAADRVDELVKRSQPRPQDPFDLPPPTGGAAPGLPASILSRAWWRSTRRAPSRARNRSTRSRSSSTPTWRCCAR